jgi:hypothetical protein
MKMKRLNWNKEEYKEKFRLRKLKKRNDKKYSKR